MRRARLIVILPLIVLLVACTDKNLETVAKSLLTTSQALGTLQSAVIAANATTPKLISDSAATSIMETAVKINQAGSDASQVVRSINSLSPTDRTKLLTILDPVIKTVGDALTGTSSLGITDDKTRNAVTASLLLIQTSLNAAKLALAVR